MNRKTNYNTKARRYILEYLSSKRDITVSAMDILSFLNQKGENISLTTVYRYLNRLTDEKTVIKFSEDGSNKSVYQFSGGDNTCTEHLHIQCRKCGKLIHLECEFLSEIEEHIKEEHGFSIDYSGSILYGLCDNCRE